MSVVWRCYCFSLAFLKGHEYPLREAESRGPMGCALDFNPHNVTALPHVICLISGTWQQLLMRQVDIQTDKGRKDRAVYWHSVVHSGSENRLKGGRRQQERLQVRTGQGWSEIWGQEERDGEGKNRGGKEKGKRESTRQGRSCHETGWRIQWLGQVSGQWRAACLSLLGNVKDEGRRRTIIGATLSWKHVGACARTQTPYIFIEFKHKTFVYNINTQLLRTSQLKLQVILLSEYWTKNIYSKLEMC